ncbi:protein MgtR [Pluralibacter gergoviae]|uniref:Protein MgtR n=1 Tax=Pluralibacter gergoviae TaxID=61647 RepID=A0AAW8HVU2_PLUGE|nr:protein MgtR [Pluralibacter gergoviae]AVR04269.1 protein MgtR [Pluralibacter gergoviae]EKT9641979.1 protein MgtR [Pluralibacter gergoviae]EKV0932535.1 protein MgtR [Pluralibacter gergoviae]EKV3545717.1 protein MgtR [Pluralibacter gergoviae]EKV6249249.1 protein MgtR [Pluralibacter gergoviae]
MNRSPDIIIALIFFLMGLLVLVLAIWQILF